MTWFDWAAKRLAGWQSAKTLNFTPRACQVLALARQEADRLGDDFLGTEHLLLGLVKLGQGLAVDTLQKLGLTLETVRREVEKHAGKDPGQKVVGNIPYTPQVKSVIAKAKEDAKALNHRVIGTEHLLLGLLAEPEGPSARIFKNFKVNLQQTRNEILQQFVSATSSPEEKQKNITKP